MANSLSKQLVLLSIVLAPLLACGRSAPGREGVAPTVESVLPLDGALGAPLATSVSALFSRSMDEATISETTFTLKQGATNVSGVVTYDDVGKTATFVPGTSLVDGRLYTATITTEASAAGVALAANYVWTFTAGPLGILSTVPLLLATEISVSKRPTATFNHEMNAATITTATFTLSQGATPIAGTVALTATTNTVTFSPSVPLDPGLVYTATITTGAQDMEQASLEADYVWTFGTGACSHAPVVLGSAGNFAALAFAAIANTTGSGTELTGDVGGASVTGAPTVFGTIHVADATVTNAIADLTTAYADAAARTLCVTNVAAGDFGGVRTPGLYKSPGTMDITSTDLTLDALGDGDAIFIFQSAAAFSTAATRRVLLVNGAQGSNVFFQVGGAASLGADSVAEGNILAKDAVSLGANTTLIEGRALSKTGAVNLNANTIVKPLP